MKSIKILFLALLATAFLTSCEKDDDEPQMSIVDLAVETPDLSELVAALGEADLVSTLEENGPFTVFAPTNDAFNALYTTLGVTDASQIDDALLNNVLLYHVAGGETKAADLSTGYISTAATGPDGSPLSLYVDLSSGAQLASGTNVTQTDIDASNGVVHLIDAVLLPPTIVDLALQNPNLSSLVAALTRGDLSQDFVSILSGDGPFTVFAPTNGAFQDLLDSNPAWTSLNDIPAATLEAVLLYHVIGSNNVRSTDLTDELSVASLQGSDLTFDLDAGAQIKTTSGQTVNIDLPDVQGTNGVVHVVDTVLLP